MVYKSEGPVLSITQDIHLSEGPVLSITQDMHLFGTHPAAGTSVGSVASLNQQYAVLWNSSSSMQ